MISSSMWLVILWNSVVSVVRLRSETFVFGAATGNFQFGLIGAMLSISPAVKVIAIFSSLLIMD